MACLFSENDRLYNMQLYRESRIRENRARGDPFDIRHYIFAIVLWYYIHLNLSQWEDLPNIKISDGRIYNRRRLIIFGRNFSQYKCHSAQIDQWTTAPTKISGAQTARCDPAFVNYSTTLMNTRLIHDGNCSFIEIRTHALHTLDEAIVIIDNSSYYEAIARGFLRQESSIHDFISTNLIIF